MHSMTCGSFIWKLELPEKSQYPSWGSRPKALIKIGPAEDEEVWAVPVSVGRKLQSLIKTSSFDPCSRAELSFKLKELSMACGSARVEALVNKRDYSSKELRDKLLRDGYSNSVCDELIERFRRANVINDERFATVYVRSKTYAGWGRRKIERELRHKGIDCESLPGWPDEFFPEDDERSRALELARRRRLTGKNDFQKIVRHLCSKGYSMNVAIDAAKSALDCAGSDDWSV